LKKFIKYVLLFLAIALVGYKSVYFRKLSEVSKTTSDKFDAIAFSKKLWSERLPARLDSAVAFDSLRIAFAINRKNAFAQHSNSMGIGNYRYSLVKVVGQAEEINEDEIILAVKFGDDPVDRWTLATEYVYGNAIRDASGLLDIKDFSNTSELNSISEELNKMVRTTVLPAFKQQVKKGDQVEVTGAVEFNKEHFNLSHLEIIPVRLKILQ
jgi:predicted lipoprotein